MSPPPFEGLPPVNMEALQLSAPAPASLKRKLGGRPKGSAPKRIKVKGPTKLRKGKPVAAEVPLDVWQMILSYCPQKFLFKARQINKSFQHALSYESAWRKNRIQNYGPDMPDPLPGMKEWEYARLIEGMGCMDCGNKKTRKCYWAFQKRWCAKCLEKNTLSESGAGNIKEKYPKLLDCIPYAVVDSYRHYESAGYYTRTWNRAGHGRQEVYQNTAVTYMMGEIDAFFKKERSEEEQETWFAERITLKLDLMERIQNIEDWVELPKRDKRTEGQRLKAERVAFFEEKAMSLTPPLTPEMLHLIPAYGRAIDIAKPPSERSWKALLPKLEADRAAAASMVSTRNLGDDDANDRLRKSRIDLYYERRHNDSIQQVQLLQLADEVLGDFLDDNSIDDQDFALLVLREVWSRHYESDIIPDLNARLLLDDAIMVFKKKICPAIDQWDDTVRSKKAKLFKCPGCTRTDVNAKYDFEDLIAHLSKHSRKLGDFITFRKPGPEVMDQVLGGIGLVVEWTRNLPVLATHQTATGKWDPHDETPYQSAQPPSTEDKPAIRLFDNRYTVGTQHIPRDRFAANAMYAAREFQGTGLHAKYKTLLGLKYALFQWYKQPQTEASREPPREQLDEINIRLMKDGEYDLFHGFRCPNCVDASLSRLRKFAEKDQSFSDLLAHFKATHSNENWVTAFMALPSEEELWEKLNEEGQEDALEVFQKIFPIRKRSQVYRMIEFEKTFHFHAGIWPEGYRPPVAPVESLAPVSSSASATPYRAPVARMI
ncbi:MAG: hypothetical protein M1836_007018 [Candelina mexicana]|nr:MAG: hypothetical protein M1836_007018 [Candelina mexicana]